MVPPKFYISVCRCLITVETMIWLCKEIKEIYKSNICFMLKSLICFVIEPISRHQQILTKLFQYCFLKVETTPMNIYWQNFHFQPNFNVETTLVHRHWIDVILSTLFQSCFARVETTSINVRWLKFYFQPNTNVQTTLFQRWFNVDVFAGICLKCKMLSQVNTTKETIGFRSLRLNCWEIIYCLLTRSSPSQC